MAKDKKIYKIDDGSYYIFGNTWGNGQFGLIYSDDETQVRITSSQNLVNPILWETITEIEDNTGGYYLDREDLETRGLPGFVGGGGATKSTELSDMPTQAIFDAAPVGSKLVKKDNDGYNLVASTTVSGFNDKNAQTLSFDDATRTLTLTATAESYSITSSIGKTFEKTLDSIQIANSSGLHGVYYNDTTGELETFTGENRSQIYERMKTSIVVSYIEWSTTDQEHQFYTKVLKGRDMNNTTWAKNAFDKEIYVLNGLVLFDDPSEGGTVIPDGNLDSSAQFGLSEGAALWTDDKHDLPLKPTGDNWTVYYRFDTDEIRNLDKAGFMCLTDVDVGIGATGRLVYNDSGAFEVVGSNNFMYHLVGISNGVEPEHRVVSFIGQNEYSTLISARNNRDVEIAAIDASFGLRQEFETVYAVLFQTRDSYGNAVRARIREISTIINEGGSSVVTSDVPPDLINGSDASYLHNHNSLYVGIGNDSMGNYISIDDTNSGESLLTGKSYAVNADEQTSIEYLLPIGSLGREYRIRIRVDSADNGFALNAGTFNIEGSQSYAFNSTNANKIYEVAFSDKDFEWKVRQLDRDLETVGDITRQRSTLSIVTDNVELDFNSKNELFSSNILAVSASVTISYANATNAEYSDIMLTITNSATTTVTFGNGEYFDEVDERFIPSTGVFTPESDGIYQFITKIVNGIYTVTCNGKFINS